MEETLYLKGNILKDIEDYDFPALKQALSMERQDVVDKVDKAGLRGRGGAGFPTGFKWKLALQEEGPDKYMICNGDEGEPGTFKDRYLLEERPLKVLEGIIIGAYATGANRGYIYIRGEYFRPIQTFEKVLKEARKQGVLGQGILDSDFNFELSLIKGAGAYVCGDETSLINSIEGKRGRSRIKPPYPIQNGLYGKPTVVNNVETLASAAEVLNPYSQEFAKLGTEESRGTKLVCVSGDVNNPGVYEVEFGKVTLEEIVYDFGKGIKDKRDLKFVIPGGISTSLLPREKLGLPYTYEDIEGAGSSLGSGAVIVVAEGHDLIDLMLNVSRFYMDETCGTCFPCREGNRQINRILRQARTGFTKSDGELVEDIGNTIRLAARCGLGQSSLNFIKSVIDNYSHEFQERGN